MKILEKKQKNNLLLNRQELELIIEADITPSKQETAKFIADETKKPEDLIVIKNIKSKFGRKTFLIIAFVYDNKEDLEKIEGKPKQKKGGEKEENKETAPTKSESPKEEITTENVNNKESGEGEVNNSVDDGRGDANNKKI